MVSERLIFRNAKARDVLRECLKMESNSVIQRKTFLKET